MYNVAVNSLKAHLKGCKLNISLRQTFSSWLASPDSISLPILERFSLGCLKVIGFAFTTPPNWLRNDLHHKFFSPNQKYMYVYVPV